VFWLVLALVCLPAARAAAHRVTVFAWVEGDTVHTASRFSSGRAARDALVEVQDPSGRRLLQGRTDQRGEFAFKVPQTSDLRIVLEAGPGHRGQWTVSRAEILAARTAPGPAATPGPQAASAADVQAPSPARTTAETGALTADAVQAMLEETLERRLQPIDRRLAGLEARAQGPSLTDILGGLGYILGLVGLAAYLQARRKE
jgi:nickel transport protein